MTPELKATLANLPDRPGVYLMKDARGEVLYVGKAQSLRSRVRSYWQKQAPSAARRYHQIREAIDRVADLEVTEVDSVSEALLLEANLIKRFKPRFNVRLKDDKSYPYIKVTLGDDFPRIERTRKLPNDGSRYFGPYASASSVDEAMNLVRRLFPFRTCTIDIKEGERALPRPCLLYHIKRCQGPCIEAISKTAYRARHRPGRAVPRGQRRTRWSTACAHEMGFAAERAAVREGGRRPRQDPGDRADDGEPEDGRVRADRARPRRRSPARTTRRAVQLFVVRNGKMLGRDVFFLDAPRDVARRRGPRQLPRAVLRPGDERPARGPRAALARRHGRPRGVPRRAAGIGVRLRTPAARREAGADGARDPQRRRDARARGTPAGWPTRARRWRRSRSSPTALGLAGPPLRIECYDISNFQGKDSVGSMVVFEEGRPRTGRVPPIPDPDGRGRRTTSRATRRCCAAGSGAPRAARRATRRSCAGRCPTS